MKAPVQRDRRQRIWRSLLRYMVDRQKKEGEGVTAKDLADEIDMDYPSILQVVRRLRAWGYVRVIGFDQAQMTKKNAPQRGRQRHIFEVTQAGMKKASWEKRRRNRK